ncbi:helix-turn-helix domain-containing protein [Bradyrhizobium tropiciagri]|uniref:helix-turn-helix domain-containing protein n=1 Tax=Bradyrhizobium tropiciagri TaxID=312253 RepID=UPI001BAD3458|nr:helix-turn-helix domain-containing protein [Bradyrhizobium tropiciagri]MBR0900664.1 helix-turn-helix domain-containing protein [Bradyrhizobium tropiciagri]
MQTQAAVSFEIARHPVGTAPAQAPVAGPFGVTGTAMRFARNAEIYGEDEDAEYVYQVISGAVRSYKILEDGRRQIGAFYLPGDVFGLEADEAHISSAEAVCETRLLAVKRSALLARVGREKELARQLWNATARELRRFQEHLSLLISSAEERVLGFLLDMKRRAAKNGVVELPMCRQDIADYLGLTIETVSRTFTQLEQSGAISLPTSRRVELHRQAMLNRLAAA